MLTIDTARAQALDNTAGKWVVICEDHSTIVNVATRADARTVTGADFCDGCRDKENTR